ncbi:hypothetical protein [Pelomonas cellulosilytica]|uniref:Uncharacterized protein n=1 Tax=Pelomonas cellulosilytica TaxID=2906762 RepID=A0ABS8XRW5_9BURK|nr:hypothetical protein [Pelomonas sp. P8]MCE4555459.1 hypothetical protein [Pelomonas sp. P8]
MGSWSTSQKPTAIAFFCVSYAGLAILAPYLAGGRFLAPNLVNPSKAGVLSIVRYWQAYWDDEQMRKRLKISPANRLPAFHT